MPNHTHSVIKIVEEIISIVNKEEHPEPEPEPEPEPPTDVVLYYCLFLPAYPDSFVPTSVSFKYTLESNQSQAASVGHYNAMSVRVLCNKDGEPTPNKYILFKGFRTPNDDDSGDLDVNDQPIIRNVKRMYFEEYEITILDDEGNNIGGLGGQLHYQDEGTGTTTSVPELNFPISHSYGIYSEYLYGNIKWQYDNEGIYLRTLTISRPSKDINC